MFEAFTGLGGIILGMVLMWYLMETSGRHEREAEMRIEPWLRDKLEREYVLATRQAESMSDKKQKPRSAE